MTGEEITLPRELTGATIRDLMSHWRAAVNLAYPVMAKALDSLGAAIGNRPVDVFEVMVEEGGEADRVRRVIRAAFEDAREAMEAYQDSPAGRTGAAELAVRLTVALAGCFQLGVWLGEGRRASLDPAPNRLRRRLAALDKEAL